MRREFLRTFTGLVVVVVVILLCAASPFIYPPPYLHTYLTTNLTSGTFGDGEVPTWNASTKKWEPGTGGTGGAATNAVGIVKTNGVNISSSAVSMNLIDGSGLKSRATNSSGAVSYQSIVDWAQAVSVTNLLDAKVNTIGVTNTLQLGNGVTMVNSNSSLSIQGSISGEGNLYIGGNKIYFRRTGDIDEPITPAPLINASLDELHFGEVADASQEVTDLKLYSGSIPQHYLDWNGGATFYSDVPAEIGDASHNFGRLWAGAFNITGNGNIGSLTVTNAITNNFSTASTIASFGAAKQSASVANGTGMLTNNGSGTFGWMAIPGGGSDSTQHVVEAFGMIDVTNNILDRGTQTVISNAFVGGSLSVTGGFNTYSVPGTASGQLSLYETNQTHYSQLLAPNIIQTNNVWRMPSNAVVGIWAGQANGTGTNNIVPIPNGTGMLTNGGTGVYGWMTIPSAGTSTNSLIQTNGTSVGSAGTINFVAGNNTTVTGLLAGAVATIAVSATSSGSGASTWTNGVSVTSAPTNNDFSAGWGLTVRATNSNNNVTVQYAQARTNTPLPHFRKWCYAVASGNDTTAPTQVGLNSVTTGTVTGGQPNATNAEYFSISNGTTSNNVSRIYGGSGNMWSSDNCYMVTRCAFTNVTGTKLQIGLSDGPNGSDHDLFPIVNRAFAAFVLSAVTPTNATVWQCAVGNGTGTTNYVVSSGISADTLYHVYEIVYVGAGAVNFFIDGASVASINVTACPNHTGIKQVPYVSCYVGGDALAKAVLWNYFYTEADK